MELSVIHNLICNTLFSKAFLLKPREAGFYRERNIVFRVLGSCEAYSKNGCGFIIEKGFSWNCPNFKTESPICQESSQFQANWDTS